MDIHDDLFSFADIQEHLVEDKAEEEDDKKINQGKGCSRAEVKLAGGKLDQIDG